MRPAEPVETIWETASRQPEKMIQEELIVALGG